MDDLNKIYAGPAITKTEKVNPFYVVHGLMEQRPAATRDQLEQEFVEMARDDAALADANARTAFLYAYVNNSRHPNGRGRASKPSGYSSDRDEKVRASIKDGIEVVKAVVVLDLVLPNGKQLRHCTGAQCKAAGGLFMCIAAKVKPNQIVGKVLTDAQAQKLWAQKR